MKTHMKYRIIWILMATLSFFSCQNSIIPSLNTGSLSISVGAGSTRTIMPDDIAIVGYRLSGTGPAGASIPMSASPSGDFTFQELAIGDWTITVDGLDNASSVIATGSTTLTIIGGRTQNAAISLVPISSGNGTLTVAISWPATTDITNIYGSLESQTVGQNPLSMFFTVTDSSAYYGGSIPAGTYRLKLYFGNQQGSGHLASPRMETIVIYPNKTTNWAIELTDNDLFSSSKDITSFRLASPAVSGTIDETATWPEITVVVPIGTDLTNLVPIFTTTGATVQVETTPQISGQSTNDFTSPVYYKVKATDNSIKTYTVALNYWNCYTTANGLGHDLVRGIAKTGSGADATFYAATYNGVSISTNGGSAWTNYTTVDGLASNYIKDIAVTDSGGITTIYAATNSGLSISTNGGVSWTTALAGNSIKFVKVDGSTIYAVMDLFIYTSTDGGASWTAQNSHLPEGGSIAIHGFDASGGVISVGGHGISLSIDSGVTWKTYTTAEGLVSNNVSGVAVSGSGASSAIYVATSSGLSVSMNAGATWTTYTTANGLLDDFLSAITVIDSTIIINAYGKVSISTDNGATWMAFNAGDVTEQRGLGGGILDAVYNGTKLYAAGGGVSVATIGSVTTPEAHSFIDAGGELAAFANGVAAAAGTTNSSSTAYYSGSGTALTYHFVEYSNSPYTLNGSITVNIDGTSFTYNGTVNFTGGSVKSITYDDVTVDGASYSGALVIIFMDDTSWTYDYETMSFSEN